MQAGQRFLDIGAYIGQDLRRLVRDGAPSTNLYAVDIVSRWDVGYDYFRDWETFGARFLEADILRPGEELRGWRGRSVLLEGKIDVVNITCVLLLWLMEAQMECCRNLVALSKAESLIVGYQVGTSGEGCGNGTKVHTTFYMHSAESWQAMGVQVGEQTGTDREVECQMRG